jgi:hypothetical protein
MAIESHDATVDFRDAPVRRTVAELYCLYLTMVFHDDNHNGRKLATLVVVGVWGAIEVGSAFGAATIPTQFFFLRLFVGVLIGRMWGIEINNFAGVEFSHDSGDGGDSDD